MGGRFKNRNCYPYRPLELKSFCSTKLVGQLASYFHLMWDQMTMETHTVLYLFLSGLFSLGQTCFWQNCLVCFSFDWIQFLVTLIYVRCQIRVSQQVLCDFLLLHKSLKGSKRLIQVEWVISFPTYSEQISSWQFLSLAKCFWTFHVIWLFFSTFRVIGYKQKSPVVQKSGTTTFLVSPSNLTTKKLIMLLSVETFLTEWSWSGSCGFETRCYTVWINHR